MYTPMPRMALVVKIEAKYAILALDYKLSTHAKPRRNKGNDMVRDEIQTSRIIYYQSVRDE